jgi:TolB-like protein
VERPFPAYSGDDPYIFVSYSHDDAELVYPEILRLHEQGFNVWYDEGIKPGATWREEVALALTESKLFLYFVTPGSVDSENCHQELNFALSRERKVLAVHLVEANMSVGIELSLSNKQAIIKSDHSQPAYEAKLKESVRALLPAITRISLPDDIEDKTVDEKSIAILPFVNRSSDPENEYLCDGLAEELITGLARVDGLTVASQLSSFALKGQTLETSAIGERLNSANVLTGSVQKSGERVRISVTLTEAQAGKVLWSERFDGTLEDVFELQEDVANKVVDALKIELGTEIAGPVIDRGTQDTAAYQYYLQGGFEFQKQTRQGLLKAHDLYSKATEQDPQFGRAYWFNFVTMFRQRDLGFVPQEVFYPEALPLVEAMNRTTFLVPTSPVQISRILQPDTVPDQKTVALEAITGIKSGDQSWHGDQFIALGVSLMAAGLLNGARDYIEYYVAAFPSYVLDTNIESGYGNLLFALGRFDKAIEHFSGLYARQPDSILNLGTRAMLYSRTGQYAKANDDLAVLAQTFPRNFAQFYDLFWRRELDAAKAYFEWMEGQKNLMVVFKIWGSFLLGYIDKGMDYLESSNYDPATLRTVALYALTPSIIGTVTEHPRYKALLASHGVDDAWRDELLAKSNELEAITGIRVALDEDY